MRALVILVVGRLGELRKTHDGIVDMIEVTASVLSLLILLFIFSVLDGGLQIERGEDGASRSDISGSVASVYVTVAKLRCTATFPPNATLRPSKVIEGKPSTAV
jgi:hypothetical protein